MLKSVKAAFCIAIGVPSAISAVADTTYLVSKDSVSPRVKPPTYAFCIIKAPNGAKFTYTNDPVFAEQPDANASVFRRDDIKGVFDACIDFISTDDSRDLSSVSWAYATDFDGNGRYAFGALAEDQKRHIGQPLPLGNSLVLGQALDELNTMKKYVVNLDKNFHMDKMTLANGAKQAKEAAINKAPNWFDGDTFSRWVLDHVL